jgi:hypothetical protein
VKRDHITSHIRVHVPLKPHKCDFCQKAFKRPQDLKKHVKTHAEDPNYNSPPEPARGHHGGGPGVFAGQQKPGDLQHLAVTAYGYSSDGHHMPGSAPVYQPYPNGNAANPSAYHGSNNNYQANYMTTLYPVSQSTLSTEYEVRKKATFDALNEFFGDIKTRQIDPSMYHAVGQRLMNLSNLPNYSQSAEYSGGTAVATAAHPNLSHYTLPMPNLRTKNDLQNIDQFLEQLQATVYEHETASQAASAGVQQAGSHLVHPGLNYRSSNSPPRPAVASSSQTLPPLTSTAADATPALTPASSVMSYNSPGSVHSAAISPVSRPSNPMYPTLSSTTSISDVGAAYTATSSASLTSTFDNDTRRYPSGMLQKVRTSTPDDSLPNIDRLGVRSPSLSNVDPALYEDEPKKLSRDHSPIDPALKESSTSGTESPGDPDWIVKIRVLESIRYMIKTRLNSNDFEDSDGDKTPKGETDHESEARSLYPVIRAIREED